MSVSCLQVPLTFLYLWWWSLWGHRECWLEPSSLLYSHVLIVQVWPAKMFQTGAFKDEFAQIQRYYFKSSGFAWFQIKRQSGRGEITNILITVSFLTLFLIFYCFMALMSAPWKPRNHCHHLGKGRHYLAGVSLSCLHIGMTPPLLCEREESSSLMR